jgi:hypothetical protein
MVLQSSTENATMTSLLRRKSAWLGSLLVMAATVAAVRADGPDFIRDVRPILSRYCFKCHGPDERNRKGDLRLDVPEEAHKSAALPGRPEKSELIARIFEPDPGKRMPPRSTKTELTAEQKDVLKRWIAAGAVYQQHWAFMPPRQTRLPAIKQHDWPKNPIDYFVLARMEEMGLKPSPPADRPTLIRRLSLDLIGLPPTPEEADAFLRDASPTAYEDLVDRLLASPRYGERWARRWLDLARYADTNGYEKDRVRIIWPYRDWVIRAINADMPFDRFTIEQIAGDLLPNATPDQIVATGFHRNTMINEEGGIDPLEFRFYAVVDRVNTTGTTWLGLTIGCAQCHTHKYDPITQREYYQMMAFLNNADEPDYEIPDRAIARRRAEIEREIVAEFAALPKRFPGGEKALADRFAVWEKTESARAVRWTVLRPSSLRANLPHLELLPDGSILASGDQTKSDTYELTFADKIKGITALRLEVLPHDSLPGRGPGRTYYEGPKGDFFLSEFSMFAGKTAAKFNHASQDYGSGASFCFDGQQATGWSTNGQTGKPHEAVFNLEKPVDLTGNMVVRMLFERYYASGLGRFRISATTDAKKAAATDHGQTIEDILAKPAKHRTEDEKQQLMQRFLQVAPELAKSRSKIDQLRAALPKYQTTMVMKERPARNPRPTHIHHRGEYLRAKERVKPSVLAVLSPWPADAPRNRLGLARWLVSPENPLTGRVIMNREWQAFFGRGLVRTTEDLGTQGELPTHPALLDWLAVEFPRQGWSLKKMRKMIVMSATYQQSSRVTPEILARDPENKLLARGPRVRLEAEMIRDSLLQVSGLLSAKMGGPSVFPPQPPSVTSEGVYGPIAWKVSPGEDRYRRGLYTFLKRSIPYAMFATFDGVSGETCQARREISNTPLQALTMLNDMVVIEAAQTLGRRIARSPDTSENRVVALFRRCLTRSPTSEERDALVAFHDRQVERLRSREQDARKIAGGDGNNIIERAAWTLVARAVLNLDEMVTKE